MGGGVCINSAEVTFTNCGIYGNHAASGGGVYIYEAEVTFTDCNIYDNTADYGGDNLYVSSSASVCLFDTELTGVYGSTSSTCPAPPSPPSPSLPPPSPSPPPPSPPPPILHVHTNPTANERVPDKWLIYKKPLLRVPGQGVLHRLKQMCSSPRSRSRGLRGHCRSPLAGTRKWYRGSCCSRKLEGSSRSRSLSQGL